MWFAASSIPDFFWIGALGISGLRNFYFKLLRPLFDSSFLKTVEAFAVRLNSGISVNSSNSSTPVNTFLSIG